jgi:transposase-like protein
MPRKSPFLLELSAEQRRELEARSRRYTLPYREVVRAKMVLLAAEGLDNDEIATRLDTRREIVSKWRKRFFEQGLPGLEERPRGDPLREVSDIDGVVRCDPWIVVLREF